MNHLVSASQLDAKTVYEIVGNADRYWRMRDRLAPTEGAGRVLATLFYEPSTRTRLSFEAAQYRLGGRVVSTEAAGAFSSAVKGESLEDTIRVVGSYADAIVLRHPEAGAALRAAEYSPVPVINAGDGDNEHPTQALLDLYTIHREAGLSDGTTVALVGDVKHSRTIHSLARLLALFPGVEVVFAHPDGMGPPPEVLAAVVDGGLAVHRAASVEEAVRRFRPDVLYMTRLQKERYDAGAWSLVPWEGFCLTPGLVAQMKETAAILHPLPRREEIPREVDGDRRAAYFRQAAYGVPVRMAILAKLYGPRPRAAQRSLSCVRAAG